MIGYRLSKTKRIEGASQCWQELNRVHIAAGFRGLSWVIRTALWAAENWSNSTLFPKKAGEYELVAFLARPYTNSFPFRVLIVKIWRLLIIYSENPDTTWKFCIVWRTSRRNRNCLTSFFFAITDSI